MVSFLFPGQGSQAVGMGKALCQRFAVARRVFEQADSVLGEHLSRLCFEGPVTELELTANSQPAILTHSIALLRVIETETALRPTVAAGHSLGEYSALVCSGTLDFDAAVRTVRKRGLFMQTAVPAGVGTMAAVVNLDPALVEAACKEAAQGEIVSPANFNGAGQIVISGHTGAIDRVAKRCEQQGATVLRLKVSAPFHCALMARAAEQLLGQLNQLTLQPMRIPVIANVDATPNQDAGRVVDLLYRQMTSTVQWASIMEQLISSGEREHYEIGHGVTLTNMMRRAHKQLPPPRALQGVKEIEALIGAR